MRNTGHMIAGTKEQNYIPKIHKTEEQGWRTKGIFYQVQVNKYA